MKLLWVIVLGVLLVVALGIVYILNPRSPTPEGEQSAALYQPGTLGVSRESIELIDSSRPTPPNDDFEGGPARTLRGFVWYPAVQDGGPFPLIVYSHGFMSSVDEAQYQVDFLVPKGYVVVAVDYPLSHRGAPGGPTIDDVINQPGDVSFLIDTLLARNADETDRLYQLIDPERLVAAGLSLGGLTSTLAAYHRDVRDPRLSAAVSIAGPAAFLEREFFRTSDVPFMMIAGSADAIVPYEANAVPVPVRVDNGLLVTLASGSHVGFARVSSVYLRWAWHPDMLVCPLLLMALDRDAQEAPPGLAPDPELGISSAGAPPCRWEHFELAMRPADQQMLTRLALYAFLENVLAQDAERRQQMNRYLATELAAENPGVTVSGRWPSPPPGS